MSFNFNEIDAVLWWSVCSWFDGSRDQFFLVDPLNHILPSLDWTAVVFLCWVSLNTCSFIYFYNSIVELPTANICFVLKCHVFIPTPAPPHTLFQLIKIFYNDLFYNVEWSEKTHNLQFLDKCMFLLLGHHYYLDLNENSVTFCCFFSLTCKIQNMVATVNNGSGL